jgi:SAM-dependent methyltransferase
MKTDYDNYCWSSLFAGLGFAEDMGSELRKKFEFLINLNPPAKNVVNIGCAAKWDQVMGFQGGEEPFALLWTLGAEKISIVDINRDSLKVVQNRVTELKKRYHHCFNRCDGVFEYVSADITQPDEMGQLPANKYELAYCSRVLCGIKQDGVEKAIREIARMIKPQCWVVSHESVALLPYPSQLVDLFLNEGFEKVKIIRQSESIHMPDLIIEYALFQKI